MDADPPVMSSPVPASAPAERVCAVVVTYNRSALLREALTALRAQSRPVDHVLVVDNASTDDTREVLAAEFAEMEVLTLPGNEGGAGGFHEGMKHATAAGYTWMWLMDDDTIVAPDALEALFGGRAHFDGEPPQLLASKVVWDDGTLHPMNYVMPRLMDPNAVVSSVEQRMLAIRFGTFVSMLVHRGAVERHGLPHKHFFIWSDDIEYTARVLRDGRGYLVPASVAHHKTATPHTAMDAAPDKFYFAVRNGIYTVRGDAFDTRERLSHLAFVVFSSVRYLIAKRFSPAAIAAILRGVRDGLLAPKTRVADPRMPVREPLRRALRR
jgi:GT2 family glycosyltransferase